MPADNCRLFFALRPDADTARAIQHALDSMLAAKGVRAGVIKPENRHLTLYFLGEFRQRPSELIARVMSAAERFRQAAFEFTLDRMVSFPGVRAPCVLLCSKASQRRVVRFRQELGKTWIAAASGERSERRFTPHVTVAYARSVFPVPVRIAPIRWRVTDFALIHSAVGRSIHSILGRWPLRAQDNCKARERACADANPAPVNVRAGESARDTPRASTRFRA
ncbi:MAG: RNA 2',3'-cyclic phosphodiesterase [Rudaea sp.]